MAWARIKFLTPQAKKFLALAASPLGQEFLPLGSRILFLPSPLIENPIFQLFLQILKNFSPSGLLMKPNKNVKVKNSYPRSIWPLG